MEKLVLKKHKIAALLQMLDGDNGEISLIKFNSIKLLWLHLVQHYAAQSKGTKISK